MPHYSEYNLAGTFIMPRDCGNIWPKDIAQCASNCGRNGWMEMEICSVALGLNPAGSSKCKGWVFWLELALNHFNI